MGGQADLELNTPDAPPEGVPAPASVSSLTFLIHDLAATLTLSSLPAIALPGVQQPPSRSPTSCWTHPDLPHSESDGP